MMRRLMTMALLILMVWPAWAQTDPRTLPRVQLADITYVGSFTYPASISGFEMLYGGRALSMGADGQSLYVGGLYTACVARISIPAVGGAAQVLDNCVGVPNLSAVNPSDPNGKLLGGVLAWNGKLIASGYSFYDGNGTATASHWSGATLPAAVGPVRVGTLNPGFVGGYMGVIPQEWRALMGYPAFTGQFGISIISRSSYGPTLSGFDPAQIGVVNPVPSTMLVGYPETHPTLGGYVPSNPLTNAFGMGTVAGGVAWPSGTRSVIFVGTRGGSSCYGSAASCNDPVSNAQGTHGYPYDRYVWLYDAGDLADVKAGLKQPWDVQPYARGNLPQSGPADRVQGATFDPVTRRIYLTLDTGGGQPRVHVYQVNVGTTPPPPPPTAVDCAGVWAETLSAPTPTACDATQQQTRTRTRTFTEVTRPQNGGAACPASPVVTQETTACVFVPPPPPPAPTVSGRVRAQSLVTAGLRLTLEVPDVQPLPAIGAPTTVNVAGVAYAATIYDIDRAYYAGSPRSTRLILTVPGLSYVSVVVALP